ncbi:MAG: Gldg family protein [Planctomycetes bacterium]|nr:Gldg family protein [Planctomycetota bacterium]
MALMGTMRDDSGAIRAASPQAVEALEFNRRTRVFAWLNFALMAVLLLGSVVMVNLIAADHGGRADWTADRIEELSPETIQRLRLIDRDVNILLNQMLVGAAEMDRSLSTAWGLIAKMLLEFQRQNPHIKVALVDPAEGLPPWAHELGPIEANTVYLQCRGEDGRGGTRFFRIGELYMGDPQTGEVEDFRAEVRLVSAICTLVNEKRKIVYGTEGHDEVRVQDPRQGMTLLTRYLRERDNVEFRRLDLSVQREVPRDADAVFVAGPRRDFPLEHLDALKAYLETGGRMLVAVDPVAVAGQPLLRRFLEAWGARIWPGVVFDKSCFDNNPVQLRARAFGQHAINGEFSSPELYVDVPWTTIVRPHEPSDKKLKVASLLRSSRESFLDTNTNARPDGDEPKSDLDLVVAIESGPVEKPRFRERPAAKMIVWGSVQGFTNELLQRMPGMADFNLAYYVNNFRWLLDLEQVITPPVQRKIRMTPLDLPEGARRQIQWVSVGVLPLLGVILGVVAFWFRRK